MTNSSLHRPHLIGACKMPCGCKIAHAFKVARAFKIARAFRFASARRIASACRIARALRIACSTGILIGAFQFLGCSENLSSAPPVDLPYTMFGVVNPTADMQAVIVYPVQSGTLQPIGPEPLDAEVRSTDLETGELRVWRDSVVSDGESGYSHIFWSDFQAEFGRSYQITTARSDGSESSAFSCSESLIRDSP